MFLEFRRIELEIVSSRQFEEALYLVPSVIKRVDLAIGPLSKLNGIRHQVVAPKEITGIRPKRNFAT
ncbi:MAG: hypothetical protein A2457_00085 [Candidatus Yanofskybacteria bacterium RIFOXYC2_FULL_44_13]|nr:MAG: hypothetical protein A2241_02455 [Candidatus Yanofskybacteria bacterium RIFOXYA2_FULL_45_28]OGN37057.1 MAG: hypothetical protein A2302_02765 [Candidatus Yanofskybacteria bacterium RIFOXYB2_FULL_44_18]OGN39300.1 MAG: hypothetical protein A2457_00085 [Candidatus Yanofskybacteria bacterium RIFOXYC2_FULL_44_13]HBT80756.1 hypothetical protein [Candidatus Yanofskybacteria bacterium]